MSNMDDSTDHTEPVSKRASFYAMNHGGTRNSLYDTTTSLEYNPRPASSHNYLGNGNSSNPPLHPNPKLSGHGYAQLVDARQSYGDVRKSASVVPAQGQRRGSRQDTSGPTGMYDEYDNAGTSPGPYGSQQTSSYRHHHHQNQSTPARDRSRPKAGAHARATSNEVVYDRF